MENCWKYCLSILLLVVLCACDNLSNETYRHLDMTERSKLAANYISLSKILESGSPEKMKILEKACRLDPRNEEAWTQLSAPYLHRGLYDEWHNYIEKAIELHPQESGPLRGMNKLHFFRDYAGALYDFDLTDTLTVDKTDYIYINRKALSVDYMRGLCYLGLKNYDRAKEYFNRYYTTESQKTGSTEVDNTAFLYIAMISNEQQDYEQAIADVSQGLEHGFPTADLYYQLAFAQFMLGQAAEAEQSLTRCRDLYNDGKHNRHRLYEVIGQLYMRDIDALDAEIGCFL